MGCLEEIWEGPHCWSLCLILQIHTHKHRKHSVCYFLMYEVCRRDLKKMFWNHWFITHRHTSESPYEGRGSIWQQQCYSSFKVKVCHLTLAGSHLALFEDSNISWHRSLRIRLSAWCNISLCLFSLYRLLMQTLTWPILTWITVKSKMSQLTVNPVLYSKMSQLGFYPHFIC